MTSSNLKTKSFHKRKALSNLLLCPQINCHYHFEELCVCFNGILKKRIIGLETKREPNGSKREARNHGPLQKTVYDWVIMAHFACWISLVDKGTAKIGEYRANRRNNERKAVYKHNRRMGRVEEKYIQRESEREICQPPR